jgi:hypothetical protein
MDRKYVVKKLGKKGEIIVQNALQKHKTIQAKNTTPRRQLIFQHLVDIGDPHVHNTRTRQALDPKDRPPLYLMEFHYISSVLSIYGNQSSLRHQQPLKADPYTASYYDTFRHDPGSGDFGPAFSYKIIGDVEMGGEGEGEAHDSEGDESEEEVNDPDNDDAQNGSDTETAEGDTETESRGAKGKGAGDRHEQRRTEMDMGFERESDAGYSTPRPATPVQQDPMDFLLRWTTKKPFFTHAKIEDWERQVAPSLVRSSPSSSKTARNPNRSGAN